MYPWKTDVAVLCIFFARPEQFEKSFEQVRKARPRVLLLWQDGPREGREDDVENIKKCREIAENIDWECEVHRNYHEKNMGCDPSTHLSHKWAFSIVDKCIILEDDLVVSQSFFPFCKELLDKYEQDERVDRICGINLLGKYDVPADYFFSSVGNSWGWASWRRVAEKWESDYKFLDDDYSMKCMRNLQPDLKPHLKWEKECELHCKEGVPYWEHIVGAEITLNHRLVIYPKVNMVSNVGLSVNSTHAPDSFDKLPRMNRQFFGAATYELSFPLTHPMYMIDDVSYYDKCSKKIKGNCVEKLLAFFERGCRFINRIFKKQ